MTSKSETTLAPSQAQSHTASLAGDDTTHQNNNATHETEKLPDTTTSAANAVHATTTNSSHDDDAVVDEKQARKASLDDDDDEEEEVDDTVYPNGLKKALITLGLCFSVFCLALDNTILATAIPRITDQFHSINDVGWYASAYFLTTCAFQLGFGKLYQYLSLKWTYLGALGMFEVGSLICGATPSSVGLIIGRAIAGIGTAGIFTGAILIVNATVPLKSRPLYVSLIGAMYGISSVAGPLMGGAFTDHVTWRLCFYINLPLGFFTAIFIIFFFKPQSSTATGQAHEKKTWKEWWVIFDLTGLLILLPTVICLLLALEWGGSTYPWNSGRIIALLVLFGVLAMVFVAAEYRAGENAMVPGPVLRQRTVLGCALFSAMLGGSFFVFLYYVPIWFQAIKGVSATKSGIMNLPLVLTLVIASLIGGAGTQIFGYYLPFMVAATILCSIGGGLLSTFTTATDHSRWIGFQAIYGVGVGFGLQLTLIAVQTVLPKKQIPLGTAVVIFSQTLGGAIMVSVAQNINTNSLLKGLIARIPEYDPSIVLRTGATELRNTVPAQYIPQVLEAYNEALVKTFYVGVATAALTVVGVSLIEFKSVKGKKMLASAA